MDNANNNDNDDARSKNETVDEEIYSKNKPKTRAKKRKRPDSESSTDIDDMLPENTLEVEKNLQASALKNNLDDVSVKKILKKVVTNDHVLALVKLREEEESSSAEERGLRPKLTRAKMKELMKVDTFVAPASAPWNLELTPIVEIPVKTRPEVKALIAQELPEDEDDDEYQPTHDDVQSDDDQTLESCSDLESQPRTPVTPKRQATSPRVVKDGPFKVPQDLTPARRKLIIDEEEATIALRTRSKLSLSATPIEHIESSFVPPDDLPGPAVDNLWNEFLKECLNPASVTRHEDDDEADPEYNVAADADARIPEHTPPAECLPGGEGVNEREYDRKGQDLTPARRKLIIDEEEATIALRTRSKLSLSATPIEHIESSFVPPDDLPGPAVDNLWNEFLKECLNPASVTRHEDDDEADPEYNVAADADAHDEDEEALENSIIKISRKELNDLVTELFNVMPEAADDVLAVDLGSNVLTEPTATEVVQASTHWDGKQEPVSDDESEMRPQRIAFEKRDSATRFSIGKSEPEDHDDEEALLRAEKTKGVRTRVRKAKAVVNISVEESTHVVEPGPAHCEPPPLLRGLRHHSATTQRVHVRIDKGVAILPKQLLILQQQLRQHIQLAASNYLQLYVNPVHWTLAPAYKQYLEQLNKLLECNSESIVNVCNLKPALELIDSWEKSVSADTPENKKMVEFIQNEAERGRNSIANNRIYVGEFTDTFKRVVANSSVFLYPYLLPAMPYRADNCRRFGYRLSEDHLIALGLDQFWQYVEENPDLYPPPLRRHPRQRYGLNATAHLVCKYMFPWLSPRWLLCHVHKARKEKDSPIYKFFEKREVVAVEHRLLPFNPRLTLYEQPEHEMPRIWVRYLSKSSKRFLDHLYKRKNSGLPPTGGVTVDIESDVQTPMKNPLPIGFTKSIISTRANVREKVPAPHLQDKFDIQLQGNVGLNSNIIVVGNVESNLKENNPAMEGNNVQILGHILPLANVCSPVVANNIQTSNGAPSGTLTTGSNKPTLALTTYRSGSITTPKIVTSNLTPINSSVFEKETELEDINSSVQTGGSTTNLQGPNNIANIVGNNVVTDKVTDATPACRSPFVMSNMYRVIQTSAGAYLQPVIIETGTVDSNNSPKTSAEEKTCAVIPNDIPEESNTTVLGSDDEIDKDSSYHCKCCILLRKICKKQTFITDFFKPKSSEKKCECNERRYPKITKRLKLLVNSYKSKSWSVHRELQKRLKTVKKEKKDDSEEESETETTDEACDLNDIAAVTTYLLKLTIRTSIIRNTLLKKKINTLFSKFDPDSNDPLWLAEELYKAFEVDVIDLYKEFLGFLTAEQADKIDKFKDYFIQSCAEDLVKKIDEEVKDKDRRCEILSHLSGMVVDNISTACEMCSGLLEILEELPRLARYVFSLFPHRSGQAKKKGREQSVENVRCDKNKDSNKSEAEIKDNSECPREDTSRSEYEIELELEQEDDSLTICDQSHAAMDYEADHSSCGEDDNDKNSDRESEKEKSSDVVDSPSNAMNIKEEMQNVIDTPELTVSKTEVQDYCDSTDVSMMIMSDSETVKSEPVEWNRDEDKLILQVLMQCFTPQERKHKTLLEIIEEKNVCQMIADSLTQKTIDDIKDRVFYLLEVLVLSES